MKNQTENYPQIESKYKNWTPWKSMMHKLTFAGISVQAAAKIADEEMDAKVASIRAQIANAQ